MKDRLTRKNDSWFIDGKVVCSVAPCGTVLGPFRDWESGLKSPGSVENVRLVLEARSAAHAVAEERRRG